MNLRPLLVLPLTLAAAHAGQRASANYSIAAETVVGGGGRVTSANANVTLDSSVGGIVGLSSIATPPETAKLGYIGQLYDLAGLGLTAAPANVNETATAQLTAWRALDDLSLLPLPTGASVTWSVLGGPLTGISATGLATAGTVYQDTAATVRGVFGALTADLEITVLDGIKDNFGAYAGDTVGDDWQVQYFGQPPNADAGPTADPDSDGDPNLYEYHARLIPNDPASFLDITLTPGPNQGVLAGQAKLTLSPGKLKVNYLFEYKNSLLDANWITLTTIVGADGTLHHTDPAAPGPRKFYRVTPTRTP